MIDLILIGLLGLAGVVSFVIIKEVFQWGYNKVNKKWDQSGYGCTDHNYCGYGGLIWF